MKQLLPLITRKVTCLFILLLIFNCSLAKEIEPQIQMDQYRDSVYTLLQNVLLDEATNYATKYMDLAKVEFSEDDYLVSLDVIFRCYQRQAKYSESLSFLHGELEWAIENQKKIIEINLKYYLGLLFKELNDYEKAIEYLLEVRESLDKELEDILSDRELSLSKIRVATDLGDVMIFSHPDKTLEYFKEAKYIATSISDSISLGDSYLNIGWAAVEIGKYENAEIYLDSALIIYDEIGSMNGQVSVFLEKGILIDHKGGFRSAIDYYSKSYDLLFNEQQYRYKSYFLKQKTLTLMSDLYTKHNVLDSALIYSLEKLDLVKGYKDRKKIAEVSNKIAKIYEARNEEKAALGYYKLSNDNYAHLKFEDARLDVLKKEITYNDKRTKKEVLGLKANLESKNVSLIFFTFLLLILCFISVLIFKSKRRNELVAARTLKAKEAVIYKKTQSMAQLSLINQSKIQFISQFNQKLESIYNNSTHKSPELKSLITKLKRSSNNEEEWGRFQSYYMELEPSFYKEIHNRYPHLTNLDIRHCILLKLKMSNNEAAEVLGVSPKSIQMARYRLKKKLNYDSQLALKAFLASI